MGYERGVRKFGRYMKRRIKYRWQERQAHFDDLARQRKMLLDEINGRMFGSSRSGKRRGTLTTLTVKPEGVLPAGHEDMVIHTVVDFDRKKFQKAKEYLDEVTLDMMGEVARDFDRKGFWQDVSKERIQHVADGLLADSPAREDSNPIDESHGQSGQ